MSAGDFTQDLDLSHSELLSLLDLSGQVKRNPTRFARALAGRYAALLFEKPSLRTRLTFELAMKQLGGDSVLSNGPIGGREPLKDVARNLDRWVNGIVARVFSQNTVDELARGRAGHQRAERPLSSLPGARRRVRPCASASAISRA